MAVEDELVLSADEVAEGEVRARVARPRDEHLLAVLRLADVERRGGEVDDQLRAGEREVGRRRARLPDVLADRDPPDDRIAEPEQDEVAALGEVAVLVEDAVVGEEVLAVDGRGRGRRRRRRRRWRDRGRTTACRRARRAVGRGGDLLDRLARRAHEPRPKEQILGRVARDRELGEDDEIGAGVPARSRSRRIFSRLPSRSPDDHVQLCERDPQGFRLTVTNRV